MGLSCLRRRSRAASQDLLGSTYLMQCSLLKPEMSLALVVKCDAPDPSEGAQVLVAVVHEALTAFLR